MWLWLYHFVINFVHKVQETLCGNAVNSVTVEASNSSSRVSVPGIMNMSADGERRMVMATFTNLEENRKYSATAHVQYGGVVQQSQPVEISELLL